MQRMVGSDGEFWVSYNLETKEGNHVAFCYSRGSALPEIARKIVEKYPEYFELEYGEDLWIKPTAELKITLDELKDVISMDPVESMVLFDCDKKEEIAGVRGWFNPDDLKPF